MYRILLLVVILIGFISSCVYYKVDEFVAQFSQNSPQESIKEEREVQNKSEVVEEPKEDNTAETTTQEEPLVEKTTPTQDIEEKVEPKVPTNEEIQNRINKLLKEEKIIFQRMSSQVAPNSVKTVEEIAKILQENLQIKVVEVAGHTDAKGDDAFNLHISQQRAQGVKDLLIQLGVEESRLIAKGYGETAPIVPNNKDGYSLINRRVEFNIVGDMQ